MVVPSHLKSLQALDLTLRLGSLKAAAEALSITPAAVGQRIKTLEDYLGVSLVVRGRMGLRAAPEMAEATSHLRVAFRELETVAELLDLQRSQEIHIAAASDFADLWLKPRLAAFKAAHPNTRFCLNGEGEAPLRIGPADCEISFAEPADEGRDVLFRDFLVPLSSPENTRRISKLDRSERLEGFPLLHVDVYRNDPHAIGWPEWVSTYGYRKTAPNRGIRFQRLVPAVEAVLSDAGLILGGLALLADLVEAGRLTLPFGLATGAWTGHAFQARFRAEGRLRPQVRRFRDWLMAEAGSTRAWLQGKTEEFTSLSG